jgi:hypothetical protein
MPLITFWNRFLGVAYKWTGLFLPQWQGVMVFSQFQLQQQTCHSSPCFCYMSRIKDNKEKREKNLKIWNLKHGDRKKEEITQNCFSCPQFCIAVLFSPFFLF